MDTNEQRMKVIFDALDKILEEKKDEIKDLKMEIRRLRSFRTREEDELDRSFNE